MLLIGRSFGLRLRFALIIALVLLASGFIIPTVAQTEQETDQEGESGETDQSGEVSNLGDNFNQCVAVQPVSNTGDALTDLDITSHLPTGEQHTKRHAIHYFLDLINELDLDLEDVGSAIELDPEQAVECAQAVDQVVTVSDYWNDYYAEYYGGYYAREPHYEKGRGHEVCAPSRFWVIEVIG